MKDFVARGDFGPLWVCADSQTAGRGRKGRDWVSPKGNLYASWLYPWTGTIAEKPLMSFVAANALADTLSEYMPQDKIGLKWPNDVLVDGSKIAGILLEAGEGWLSIGIGLNLQYHPENVAYPTTHVAEHICSNVSFEAVNSRLHPDEILKQIVQNIEFGMAVLQDEGFVPIRRKWLSRATRLGERINVNLGEKVLSGVFETIGKNGALKLRLDDNTLRDIMAGDVLL